MKASTLVIMLCMSLMFSTGFGSTTADLTTNSTAETIVEDHEHVLVNVVSLDANQVLISEGESLLFDASVHSDLHADKELTDSLSISATIQKTVNEPAAIDAVVPPDLDKREAFNYDLNYPNTFNTLSLFRNPRDGIRCNLS